jgi:hypothetical protein
MAFASDRLLGGWYATERVSRSTAATVKSAPTMNAWRETGSTAMPGSLWAKRTSFCVFVSRLPIRMRSRTTSRAEAFASSTASRARPNPDGGPRRSAIRPGKALTEWIVGSVIRRSTRRRCASTTATTPPFPYCSATRSRSARGHASPTTSPPARPRSVRSPCRRIAREFTNRTLASSGVASARTERSDENAHGQT